jgi:hypothetical protein
MPKPNPTALALRNARNREAVKNDQPALRWIKFLHEVGTVRTYAEREAGLLEQIASYKRVVEELRNSHANLIKEAETAVARDWSIADVATAEGLTEQIEGGKDELVLRYAAPLGHKFVVIVDDKTRGRRTVLETDDGKRATVYAETECAAQSPAVYQRKPDGKGWLKLDLES